MTDRELYDAAVTARENAYAPYSSFLVGAALLAVDGRIYSGCNIENAAGGPGNCAERTAFFKAVSEGERSFAAIAIAGGAADAERLEFCPPCGVCRQVMREFCDPGSFRVIMGNSEGATRSALLEELLPLSFGPGSLEGGKERE